MRGKAWQGLLTVLTDDQKKTIREVSRKLDGFDKVVRTLTPAPLPKSPSSSANVAIDSPALLSSLASRFKGLKQDQSDFEQLTTDDTMTEAHKRLTAARLIARWKLNNPEICETDLNEIDRHEMTETLNELTSSERLKASAIDLLASAILLPRDTFESACFGADHAAGALAKDFDVPLGVVTLRQFLLTQLDKEPALADD